jgi:putative protease
MTPELLSPAGDWDALRAAVANGANAVYFGLPTFNARHRATNFTLEELPHIFQYLHERNVKGFVTLNTLIFSDELHQLVEYLTAIVQARADAVIVQDLGVVALIKRLVPGLHVHASTQMTLTEPRGIAFARNLGIERVVLARELSIEDIRKITRQTEMPVEVFVHGALCVAYSGQCLTSEALGGRSANRGQCAQACRLPYELIVDHQPRDLGDRAYLLSPQDLAAVEQMNALIQAGVISFKIEGRLKSAHYVAATTQTYRSAIDAATEHREFHLTRVQERDLAQTFSRGFTPGFLEGVNHQQLVQGRFPKSRGVKVGTVRSVTRRSVFIELVDDDENLVKPGDGVVFDAGKPEEDEIGGRIWQVRRTGSLLGRELGFESDTLDLLAIPAGCIIWKTDDPALRKQLEATFAVDRRVRREPIWFHASGKLGGSFQLTVRDADRRQIAVDWPGPLEAARKHPVTLETLRDQLSRLGDTPFELADVSIDLPEEVMVPKSVLNYLRRQAVAELERRREERTMYTIREPDALQQFRNEICQRSPDPIGTKESQLTVLVRTMEQLEAICNLKLRPEMVYCDFEDTRRYREAVTQARAAGIPIGLATLRIFKPSEEGFLNPIVHAKPDAVLVRNLGAIAYFQEHLPQTTLVGDFSLNVANELTADILMRSGLAKLVPSFDLNWDQLAALVERSHPDWYETVIHQHMPMFHMEHCVFAAFLSTGKDFHTCGRPCDRHRVELRDRVGAEFPVVADAGCRNTVFNSVAQSAAEYVGRMREIGLRRFRVDLLRESASEVTSLLDRYMKVISGADDGKTIWRQLQVLNQLGVTRGTLQMV